MYMVTFYSYKGGVGRTMAMVNCAAELASRGRKVLLIDFDLEAPGVTSFPIFSEAHHKRGVVDYISDYVEKNASPNVDEYVHSCRLDLTSTEQEVWVMPAGDMSKDYSAKFAAIDWQYLYEHQEGYLFFEDFRSQLRGSRHKFDYILIDSRTGYTDVGGICTRQLADAVVAMFFPNEQNIAGLEIVARDIRKFGRNIEDDTPMFFCMSNVPDMDDEDGVLSMIETEAKARLGFSDLTTTIHHYSSMSLLSQQVFTITRPRTRLSHEYRTLTDAIIQSNIEDRDGARFSLENLQELLDAQDHLRRRGGQFDFGNIEQKLGKIKSLHGRDPDILWNLAKIYRDLGNLITEAAVLEELIALGEPPAGAFLQRAKNLLTQSRFNEAVQDLTRVLFSEQSSAFNVISAIELLKSLEEGGKAPFDWREILPRIPHLHVFSPAEKATLITTFAQDPSCDFFSRALVQEMHRFGEINALQSYRRSEFVLSAIGLGEFDAALAAFKRSYEDMLRDNEIADVFNYAMALWGKRKRIDKEIVRRVLILDEDYVDDKTANYFQCIALCHLALGDPIAAQQALREARRVLKEAKIFSCWRYRIVTREEMLTDLVLMDAAAATGSVHPPFVYPENKALAH